jgi:hypothetical protein
MLTVWPVYLGASGMKRLHSSIDSHKRRAKQRHTDIRSLCIRIMLCTAPAICYDVSRRTHQSFGKAYVTAFSFVNCSTYLLGDSDVWHEDKFLLCIPSTREFTCTSQMLCIQIKVPYMWLITRSLFLVLFFVMKCESLANVAYTWPTWYEYFLHSHHKYVSLLHCCQPARFGCSTTFRIIFIQYQASVNLRCLYLHNYILQQNCLYITYVKYD